MAEEIHEGVMDEEVINNQEDKTLAVNSSALLLRVSTTKACTWGLSR